MKITKLDPSLCPAACAEITRRASYRQDGKCVFNGLAYAVENGEVWHVALQGTPERFENTWTDANFKTPTPGQLESFNAGMAREGRKEGEFFHGKTVETITLSHAEIRFLLWAVTHADVRTHEGMNAWVQMGGRNTLGDKLQDTLPENVKA